MEQHSREGWFPWLGRSRCRVQEIILGRELLALLFLHPQSRETLVWSCFLARIPVGRLFAILRCVLSTPYPDERGWEVQSSSLACPPGDVCTPLLLLQSAFLQPCCGPGQEGDRSPLLSRPLLPEQGSGLWLRSTLLFSNSSAASGPQEPSVSGTGVPLSAVGNHGLASWEGRKGHRRSLGSRPAHCRWSRAPRHFCCCPPKPH